MKKNLIKTALILIDDQRIFKEGAARANEHTSRLNAIRALQLYSFISNRQSSFAAATPFEMCIPN